MDSSSRSAYVAHLQRFALACATVVMFSACGSGGELPPSSSAPGGTTPPPGSSDTVAPTQPGTLIATPDGPFRISLTWQASSDNIAVTTYRIERCLLASCGAYVEVAATTSTGYVDAGLTPATDYSYRVRAGDAAGNLSAYSTTAAAGTDNAPTPPPIALPAWVSALAPGQWFEIPNTALSSVNPVPQPPGTTGPSSKVVAWTSFVVDRRSSKVYSAANGGHADYSGNEVDVLDLELVQPVWSEILASSPSAQIPSVTGLPCTTSYYLDGRPTSRHSYYGVTIDETSDRIMLFGGGPWCQAGGFHAAVSSYNIGANSWSASGSHPDIPAGIRGGVPAYAANPSTGDVYGAFNFQLVRWNRTTNTFDALSPIGSPAAGDEAMSAFDSTRGRVLFLSNIAHHYYTPSTNTWTQVSLSGPGATDVATRQGALVYIEAIDLFLVRLSGSGGAVYQIDPVSFEVSSFPGGAATSGGATIPATVNGPYNKFLYVPRLQGAVYVPSHSGNSWFLRIY